MSRDSASRRGEGLPVGGLDDQAVETLSKSLNSLSTTKCDIPTKCYALGGIEEIGKNTYCIEHDDEIIVIDVGVKFVNRKHFPGLSGSIPSMSYLKANQKKIKALVITHGHEDHIGGIVHVLKQVSFPVIYSPIMASELLKRKISENSLPDQNIVLYTGKSVFLTKHFVMDFYRVNHSIPDCFGICMTSPNGIVVFSGDFRFDFVSKDDKFDLQKIGEISNRGVSLLLCESTNAEQPGFNESEKGVINELHNIMSSAEGRIIITFFASNIGRVEEVFKIAVNLNKKIVILGHAIDSNVTASQNVGYLRFDDKHVISPKDMGSYPDNEILVICTGSQGEDSSALSSISKSKHPNIKLKSTDSIIFSSNVIPGNTYAVEALINRLYKSGCNIYLNSPGLRIHSSGHATKLEQQLFVSLVNAKYIVPVHGESKMLKALSRNCIEIGYDPKNILLIKNGDVVHLLNGEAYISDEKIDASVVYIDGDEITFSGEGVSAERASLGEKGLVACHLFIDSKKKKVHLVSPVVNVGSFVSSDMNYSKLIQKFVHREVANRFKKFNSLEEVMDGLKEIISDEIYVEKKQRPNVELFVSDVSDEDLWKDAILPKEGDVVSSSSTTTTVSSSKPA